MACAIDLRTDTQATTSTVGGTWYYRGTTAWTVKVDGVTVTLAQDAVIGTNDNPSIETDASHIGNSYTLEYDVPASAGCSATTATYTINVQDEPCDILDGVANICEGANGTTDIYNFLNITNCGTPPVIDEWTVVSGNGSGFNPTTAAFNASGYTSGQSLTVQAKINGASGTLCPTCIDKVANVVINITTGAYAGPGGAFNVCA